MISVSLCAMAVVDLRVEYSLDFMVYRAMRICFHPMKCLATCLLIALLSLPLVGQVICIGADGHVVVESALNGKCFDGPSRAATDVAFVVASPSADFSDCGVCVDILVGSNAKARRVVARHASSPVPLVLPVFIALNDAAGTPRNPASHPPRHRGCTNTPLAHLQTVSLLV